MLGTESIAAFIRCPVSRKILLAEAIIGLASTAFVVRFLPFRQAILKGSVPVGRQAPTDRLALIQDVRRTVKAASARVPWRTVCLQESLTAQLLLRRRGIDAVLHYGVAKKNHGLQAHVWVTACDQNVIGGEIAAWFKLLATYPDKKGGGKGA